MQRAEKISDGNENRRNTYPAPTASLPSALPDYAGHSYYDLTPIKHSHYKWNTALAFLSTQIAGGTQIIATVADLRGQNRRMVRVGRYFALAGGLNSTAILIGALHTPQRWYNMLRIFKKSSPMSIGIWSISPFTFFSGLAAAGQVAADIGYTRSGNWTGRAFSLPAALLGSVAIAYMGTELEETNMPAWASAYPLMAPLYACAGVSNAAAALLLLPIHNGTSGATTASIKKLAFISGAAELALGAVLDDHWRRSAEATAIAQSRNESWYRMGFLGLGMLSSLTLLLWDRFDTNRSRLSDAASVLKLAGALVQQTVLVYAGQESGRRARDYFAYTREPMIGNNAEHADRSADHKKMNAAGKGRGTRPLPKMRRSSSRSVVAWGLFACGALLIGAAVLRNKENSQ